MFFYFPKLHFVNKVQHDLLNYGQFKTERTVVKFFWLFNIFTA